MPVWSAPAAIAEEDLIAHLGVFVAAALLLVVLHAIGATCTVGAGLALDALAFGFAVYLEEAPVYENVAPCVSVLIAIIIARRRKVAGVFCPVGVSRVGRRIVKVFVAGLLFISDLAEGQSYDFTCSAHRHYLRVLLSRGAVPVLP